MSETQGPTVIAVAAVFAVLLFFTLILRIYARVVVVKSVGPDDYLIIVAAKIGLAVILGLGLLNIVWSRVYNTLPWVH
ncbi:hypothetical protein HYQ44_020402 [Verticillium longisporum]|nr:hypothetical protein HYQ44_020402 [Verticillium longisporum]